MRKRDSTGISAETATSVVDIALRLLLLWAGGLALNNSVAQQYHHGEFFRVLMFEC